MKLVLLIASLAVAAAFASEPPGGDTSFHEPLQITNGPANFIDVGEDQDEVGEENEDADMSDLLGRSRWCRSRGGRCRSYRRMPSCPAGFQSSPTGRPYCMGRNRRCCYPGTPGPTTTDSSTTMIPDRNCTRNGGTEFMYGGLTYCLRRTCTPWDETIDWCEDMGMEMAQPLEDPIGLATYIHSLSLRCWYWVGARGDGSNQVWLYGPAISNTSPLWYGTPNVSPAYCTALSVCNNLTTPLLTYACASSCGYRLCQESTGPVSTTASTTTTSTTPTTTLTMTTPVPDSDCARNGGTEISYDGSTYCLRRTCTPWNETEDWCEGMGMEMAEPYDPIGLATYIYSLSLRCWYWVGARGDGSNQVWLDGTAISNTSPYWHSTPNVASTYCTALSVCNNLTMPLLTYPCASSCGYRLCQKKTCLNSGGTEIGYGGSSYCLRRTCTPWDQTRNWCDRIDMVMAEPSDPIGLATYIGSLSLRCWYWVGARGDGSNQVWLNGTAISNTSPLWGSTPNDASTYCTALSVCRNLTAPLLTYECTSSCGYRLCEERNCLNSGGTTIEYGGSSYCLKRTCTPWNETREWCEAMGMEMAEPSDPIGLATHIHSHSLPCWYWLGAKGDGFNQVWLNGTAISNTSPLWGSTPNDASTYCTALTTCRNLTAPLLTYTCTSSCGYRLCQARSSRKLNERSNSKLLHSYGNIVMDAFMKEDSSKRIYDYVMNSDSESDAPEDNKDDNLDEVEPHKGDESSKDSNRSIYDYVWKGYSESDAPEDNKDDNLDEVEPHKGDESSKDSNRSIYDYVMNSDSESDAPEDNKDDNLDEVEPHKVIQPWIKKTGMDAGDAEVNKP